MHPQNLPTETYATILAWCQKHNVLLNSYSPFGGPKGAPKLFSDPKLKSIATAHNATVSKVILGWALQLGIAVNPEATNPKYQAENLDIFGLKLNETEMAILNTWKPQL